jgi:hypothetical protein
MGCGLCTQKQDNVDDDDNPSRPDRRSSFMFPSVGQTFLRCVSGRPSIKRGPRVLSDKVYPLGPSLSRAELGQFYRHWLNLGHQSFEHKTIGGT